MAYEGEYSQVSHIFPWLVTESFALDRETPVLGVVGILKHQQADPELFNNLKAAYSRLCQGRRKPMPVESETGEYITKYWNFTKQAPQYYQCNKQHPYLYFITGAHKKNYCLPCCSHQKTQSINQSDVYNTCLTKHEYVKQKEQSKYNIVNASNFHVGRLTVLSDAFMNQF